MTALLRFRNVTLGYDRHPAVHHLNGEIAPGALLAVVGPNGAGKSTLLRAIAGLQGVLAGSIERLGHGLRDIAYLPQSAQIDLSFPMSVFDLASTGLWHETGMIGGFNARRARRVADALQTVGLSGFENRWIGSLSGGQMQRLLFARVMLQDAQVIVLDEPFNALDGRTSADLLACLARWHDEGRTVIAALHDLAIVRAHFPSTLVLARRLVAWDRTPSALNAETMREADRMCEAFDDEALACSGSAPRAA